jgi:hypothetical protein
MNPALLAMILVAMLIALLPVWRLRVAGWPLRSLLIAWLLYSAGVFAVLRVPGLRLLVPILVLAYVAPFVAGPERLSRVLNGRPRGGVVIDVTPRPAPGLPEPGDEDGAPGDEDGAPGDGRDPRP